MDQETPPSHPSVSVPSHAHAVALEPPHNCQPDETSSSLDLQSNRNLSVLSNDISRANPSFLELPAEIRNMIYTWLFPAGNSAVQLLARYNGGYIDMGDCLGLLATCRQVYHELSSLLRSERRFVVVQPKTIVDVLHPISKHPELSRRVMDHVCHDCVFEIRYDLDKRTKEKNGPPFYEVCHRICNKDVWYFFFRLRITATTSYPFKGLEEWGQIVSDYLEATRSGTRGIVVILRLPQADSDGRTDIYLPAVRLFRVTKDIDPWTKFKVVAVDEDEANVRSSH